MDYNKMSLNDLLAAREKADDVLNSARNKYDEIEEAIYDNYTVKDRKTLIGKCYSYKNAIASDITWTEYSKIIGYNEKNDIFSVLVCYDAQEYKTSIIIEDQMGSYYDPNNCFNRSEIAPEIFNEQYNHVMEIMKGIK